jgi:hypothetical protein
MLESLACDVCMLCHAGFLGRNLLLYIVLESRTLGPLTARCVLDIVKWLGC